MKRSTAGGLGAAALLLLATGCAAKSSSGASSAPKQFPADSQPPVQASGGYTTGATARGSITAAEVGGSIGFLIGQRMDEQARELVLRIPGATVRRVGEGIIVSFPEAALFSRNTDSLTTDAREQLRRVVASLQKFSGTAVMITGHSAPGSSFLAGDLSARRAGVAAAFMASEGVDRTRLLTAGRGDTEPITSNVTEAGRAQNRRVEMAIYAGEAMRAAAP